LLGQIKILGVSLFKLIICVSGCYVKNGFTLGRSYGKDIYILHDIDLSNLSGYNPKTKSLFYSIILTKED